MGLSYKFKNGGRVPDNLKALDGGHFKKLASDVYLAKGKTHKAGGIKGDVDNDGQPELELEGNELYFDDAQYIINKDISKQFTNSFSKRGDKVAQNTNDMLKKMAIGENEKLLSTKNYKNGGKLPKYVKGGPNLIPESFLDAGRIASGLSRTIEYADPYSLGIDFINNPNNDGAGFNAEAVGKYSHNFTFGGVDQKQVPFPFQLNNQSSNNSSEQSRQDAFMQDPVRNSASIYDPMVDYTNTNASFAVPNLSFNSLNQGSRANSMVEKLTPFIQRIKITQPIEIVEEEIVKIYLT